MKYEQKINAEDARTSHGLVARLVGSGKRVLDVGCADGQLGEFLQRQGNSVSGVEIDPDLADVAKSRIGTVLVGDVEHLDLVAELGRGSVEVVIFADVLEHLKNPLAVVRQARELLADGGCLIASIPNIAHGAARLALLQGRFEYRELGLLDDTHLRFFTRSSVDSLLRSAGFIIAEWERTTAGPFETEIPLSPGEFSSEIVERVDEDPDSQTYQFVVRALPIEGRSGDQAVVAELEAKGRELELLRRELAAIARGLRQVPAQPVVGLLDAASPSELEAVTRLRTAVVLAELRRRLVGFVVRAYGLRREPSETGLVGEPVRPLLPWDKTSTHQLRAEAEAIVALVGTSAHPDLGPIVDDLVHAACPLHVVTPDPPWGSAGLQLPAFSAPLSPAPGAVVRRVGDPLMLIRRLVPPELLLQRAEYLMLLRLLPETAGFVLGYLSDVNPTARSRARQALESVARRAGTDLVVIDAAETLGGCSGKILSSADLTTIDLLATLAAAGLVITDSPAILALATGLARPALGIAGDEMEVGSPPAWAKEQLAGRLDELVALAPIAIACSDLDRQRDDVAMTLDFFFDDLASDLLSAGAGQLTNSVPQRVAELTEQVRTLEAVNAGLRAQLARERTAIAGFLRQDPDQARLSGIRGLEVSGSERALWNLNPAHAEIQRLQGEIAAIYATKSMRAIQPARRLYGRLRTWRR